jgi:hypothetical protein
MRAYFAGPNGIKRDEIAARQLRSGSITPDARS